MSCAVKSLDAALNSDVRDLLDCKMYFGDGTPVPCDTSCDGNLPFREFYNQESGSVWPWRHQQFTCRIRLPPVLRRRSNMANTPTSLVFKHSLGKCLSFYIDLYVCIYIIIEYQPSCHSHDLVISKAIRAVDSTWGYPNHCWLMGFPWMHYDAPKKKAP